MPAQSSYVNFPTLFRHEQLHHKERLPSLCSTFQNNCQIYVPREQLHTLQGSNTVFSSCSGMGSQFLYIVGTEVLLNESHHYPVHRGLQLKNKIKFSRFSPDHSLKTHLP